MDFGIAASSTTSQDWESERQTLLDLLEHTQALLKAAQDSAGRERQDTSEQHRLLELRLTTQLRLVKEENASLKAELERGNKAHGLDDMSLKGYMLKEIEKVENRASEREAELMGRVESASNEVRIYKGHLEMRARGLEEERAQLQRELDQAWLETKRNHTYYSTQIQDLKTELSATTNHYRKSAEDIKATKAELAALESVEAGKRAQMKAAWDSEKEALQSTIKRLQRTVAEKEKLAVEFSSAKETDLKAELTPLKAQNETLSFDKLALKQQLQMAASLYGKKEKSLQLQLDKYKRLSAQLKEPKASAGSDCAFDSGRLFALLMAVEEYDRLIREKLEKVGRYADSLAARLGESPSGQSCEVKERLLDELIGKLSGLREVQSTGVGNAQTQANESAFEDLKSKISEALVTITATFTQNLQDLTKESTKFPNIPLKTPQALLPTEQFTLQTELQETTQELEHAKATVLSYKESISALEEVITKSQGGGEVNAEAEKLKIEVNRLAQENANLTANSAKFRGIIEAKSAENEILKANLTKINEEIEAFYSKLEATRTEISSLLQTFPSTVLPEECNSLLQSTLAKWKEETSELEPKWTDLLKDAELQATTLSSLNKTLGDLLHTLTQLAETLSNQVEDRNPLSSETAAEVESLRVELAAKQQEHEEEMEMVKSRAEAEVRSVKTMEIALTTEIAALRARLRDLKSPR